MRGIQRSEIEIGARILPYHIYLRMDILFLDLLRFI